MANRYAEDIRRIAGTDDLSSTPEKNPEKDPIRGRRGIAYIKPDGSIGGASGESGATTQPSDGKGGENAPSEEGSQYGSNTGGSGVTVKNEGGTDSDQPGENNLGIIPAESLADGTAGVGDSFDGTELYDCGSGQKYTVRSDGQFTPPDGWDDANTPPVDPEYQDGYFWHIPYYDNNGCVWWDDIRSSTPSGALSLISQPIDDQCNGNFYYVNLRLVPNNNNPITSYNIIGDYQNEGVTIVEDASVGNIFRVDCSESTEDYCTVIPYEESWPTDSPAQLSWDPEQAAFLTSEYDTNVDQKYKDNNVGELNMCDFSGNPVQVQAGKDGGLVYTFSGGVVVVKDASGKIVAGVSLSNKDQYLAKQT